MVEFPKIPTRVFYHGDKDAAKKLIGFGKKRYADLVKFMKPRRLKVHQNQIQFSDGSIVETQQNHGLSEIHLYVPLGGKEDKLKQICFPCYCECGITIGKIIAGPADSLDDPDKYIPSVGCEYDGEFCQSWEPPVHTMEEVDDISPTDFYPHRGPEPELIDEVLVPTRKADKVYGLVQAGVSNIDGVSSETDFEDIQACYWLGLSVLSLNTKKKHVPKAKTCEMAPDG